MRFTSTVAGETLDALVRRSYDIEDAASGDLLESARTNLLAANPFVDTLDAVPDGTQVAVPDVPGPEVSAQALSPDQAAAAVTVDQLDGALASPHACWPRRSRARWRTSPDRSRSSREARSRSSPPGDDQLSAALPELIQAATARAEAGKQLQEYEDTVFAELAKDLQALRGAFG